MFKLLLKYPTCRLRVASYFLLITVLSFAKFSFASDTGELIKKGNEYYREKQFEKAIDAYQQIIHMGYEGTALYYNLGNSYYKEGKLGYAILYYEKAHKLSPGDEDILHNLTIVNTKTVDKLDSLPRFFIFEWWESFLSLLSVKQWAYLTYVFYILMLAAIGMYFFAKRPFVQRYSFFSGLIAALLLILAAIPLIINLNRAMNDKNAIIIAPSVTVKLAPDLTSNDAFIVHEGLKIKELDYVENWIKIKLQDGKEGWVQQGEIGSI
jgi:tetratricopeptide (TPR) repeat protein